MNDIVEDWKDIRKHFNGSFRQNLHVVFASLDREGRPCATPIGTLFLNQNQTGFYFEKFVSQLPVNKEFNNCICVLAVNTSKRMWLTSLFMGKFSKYPGLKLYGCLGHRRKASELELSRLGRRMKFTKGLKGHTYLWGDMDYIREITFHKVELINLGKMTIDL